jgi:hypothetical protein
MTASDVGDDRLHLWIKQRLGLVHAPVCRTVAWAVLCLLLAQRATPAALARALPAAQGGSGRACVRRVRRWWNGPPLDQAPIRPQWVPMARSVLPPGTRVIVALDTTRLGAWEVWLAGIVVGGRTLPIGWAVLPSPWPKGRFRATPLALLQQLQGACPVAVRWTLVADRGCPRAALFALLRQGGTDFSGRWRRSDGVTVAGVYTTVAAHLEGGRLRVGQRTRATMGRGRSDQPFVPGWLVVSAALVVPPTHQQHPGTGRARAKRAKAHAQHRAHQQGRKTPLPSAVAPRYAQPWLLFTTASTVAQATMAYAGRMSIEETSRDWPHHWAVRAAVGDMPTEAMVTRVIGGVCWAYTVQMSLGQRVCTDPVGQQRRAQWTVTGRVSWCWCGQRLFADPGDDWRSWLAQQWERLGQPTVVPPVVPVPAPALAEAA